MKHSTQAQQNAHTILVTKEGEKDKPDSQKSRTENVEKSKDVMARICDVNDMLCEKPSIDLTRWSGKILIEELNKDDRVNL